ncbi:glycosyltransferase family 4 protein [Pseudomonas oryzihabitans]|uniref:glycosyltransferase family 4 protein n=1 Tax=Pseudomonas oryzihabitans TaxID=47885 RepID=UPI001F521FD4|nr:glycosyltransferase family 4 protein [Pseudomonas oryzihabitans]MCI1008547.1 glycosyltransferase family 4 protein [Pseudomonas oryzihabitans]
MEKGHVGCVDSSDGKFIYGWAFNKENPFERVEVLARQAGRVLGAAIANKFRSDLVEALGSDGNQGFVINLPILESFEPINVVLACNGQELINSPIVANLSSAIEKISGASSFGSLEENISPEECRKLNVIKSCYGLILDRAPSEKEINAALHFLSNKDAFEFCLNIIYSEELLSKDKSKLEFGKIPRAVVNIALASGGLTERWQRLIYCLSKMVVLENSSNVGRLFNGWEPASVIGSYTVNNKNEVLGWVVDVGNPYNPVEVSYELGSNSTQVLTCGAPHDIAFKFPSSIALDKAGVPNIIAQDATLSFIKTNLTSIDYISNKAVLHQSAMWEVLANSNARGVLQQSSVLDSPSSNDSGFVSAYIQHAYFERFGKRAAFSSTAERVELVSWYINDFRENWDSKSAFPASPKLVEYLQESSFAPDVTEHYVPRLLLLFWKRHFDDKDYLFSRYKYQQLLYKMMSSPNGGSASFIRICGERLIQPLLARHPDSSHLLFDINYYWRIALEEEYGGIICRDLPSEKYIEFTFNKIFYCFSSGYHIDLLPLSWIEYWKDMLGNGLSRLESVISKALLGYDPSPEEAMQWLKQNFYSRYPQFKVFSSESGTILSGKISSEISRFLSNRDKIQNKIYVIGHTSQTGLGANLWMTVNALRHIDINPAIVSVDRDEVIVGEDALKNATEVSRPIIIFHVNADRVPYEISRLPVELVEKSHKVGFFLWETSSPPQTHMFGLQLMDEIWVPTTYLEDIYRKYTEKPIFNVRKGISAPDSYDPVDRKVYGVKNDDFVFLSIGDFHSSIPRKNPLSVVEAFKVAFPTEDNVKLVLKLRNIDFQHWCNKGGYWQRVLEAIGDDSRIKIIDYDLSPSQYWGLIASVDAFVSLHKSEGFGYGIAHSMLLEKPTVVSDYSGSTDFCSNDTSFLVKTIEVPVELHEMPILVEGAVWCMPDIDSAASQLREVYSNPPSAKEKAEKAKRYILTNYSLDKLSGTYYKRLGLE